MEILDLPDDILIPRSLDEPFFSLGNVLGLSDGGLLLAWFSSGALEGQSDRAYLFDRGAWTPLLSPSDDHPNVLGREISPTGFVVGTVGADRIFDDRRQVVWIDGSPRDIEDSLPVLEDGLTISRLLAINSNGEILANAYDSD